jgi:hypothetical protein
MADEVINQPPSPAPAAAAWPGGPRTSLRNIRSAMVSHISLVLGGPICAAFLPQPLARLPAVAFVAEPFVEHLAKPGEAALQALAAPRHGEVVELGAALIAALVPGLAALGAAVALVVAGRVEGVAALLAIAKLWHEAAGAYLRRRWCGGGMGLGVGLGGHGSLVDTADHYTVLRTGVWR